MSVVDAMPFVISRTVDAPRDVVFRVHTDCEHLKRWWGPKGFTVDTCRMDLRTGGMFLYGLKAPDGSDLWGRWIFREITPPERLVFVVSFSDPQGGVTRNPWSADWPLHILSTLDFAEKAGRTTVTVSWLPLEATETECQVFAAAHDSMRQGWGGTLDKLGDHLARATSK